MGAQTFLLPWKTKEITVNFSINDFVTFNGYESPPPPTPPGKKNTKKTQKTQLAKNGSG